MNEELIELTSDVVAAYVGKNPVQQSDLPELIRSVYQALSTAASGAVEEPKVELKPAVPIKKSVTPDHIICLEDGKKFKSLKRHLRTHYDLSPEEYRAKWGLPADYPMVAPNYAAARSALAKQMGLGQKPQQVQPKTRGRKKAA
ncbi:MucR family transcriptional regulator [Lutibaculum baratangense]|uniref:Transcriptional regulator n=1 Tax=Lutibaculum baratangense AMV1 TaxID=631454 RepID=V4TAH8_9HYPH|nr:MucR family transcriptional regulator [Lutibaculum baratangense]ESR23433.1 transcriptional regulator [Lutibaculum baratangense AMV1]